MVSGNPAKVAELMPIFRLWGPTVVVAGDKPGPAQIMKLTNNILAAVAGSCRSAVSSCCR
jgi:3-hydroxyisobutyrate dehydrogenase-like beta-hydroxyacid dehydrogenase